MKKPNVIQTITRYYLVILVIMACQFSHCSSEKASHKKGGIPLSENIDSVIADKVVKSFNCSKCKYVVPAKTYKIDGIKLGIRPGDYICLSSRITYGPIKFMNLRGKPGKPITIVNCGGVVNLKVDSNQTVAVRFDNCQYFKISGIKQKNTNYGISISGAKTIGLSLEHLCSNFEIENIEVSNVGFAGIMAKTDPSCDDETIRDHYTMRNASFHDNYIHHTGGEGFYIGNSFYDGFKTKCGIRMPHDITGLKVYRNIVRHSGWEGIQVGCATKDAEIYDNVIENFGEANIRAQNNGIQIGVGTGGYVYNNVVRDGTGNGMIVLGLGDNVIFNNIIIKSGEHGIFCDERNTPGPGFKFINNTIINPQGDGIRIYAEKVAMNYIVNNIIVNPGAYAEYQKMSRKDPYVNKLNDDVKIDMSNNIFTRQIEDLRFADPQNFNYSPTKESPSIDAGRDVSEYHVNIDFLHKKRPKGKAFDIGAYEY